MPTFLYPPRPEKAIAPMLLDYYERKGWVCQKKMNGTCSEACVDPSGHVEYWTRHHDRHKAWTPTKEATEFFSKFPDSIFIFELLHSKGGGVRDTLYFFDVLRYLGRDLVGTAYADRLELLRGIVPNQGKFLLGEIVHGSFRQTFNSLSSELEEGIVLKDPNALLRSCYKDGLNAGWQVKCRKPQKNFGF